MSTRSTLGPESRPFLRRRQAHALETARLAAERQAARACCVTAPVSVLWAEPLPSEPRVGGNRRAKRRARHGDAG